MKICPNCNAECADDTVFCQTCGTNLSSVQPQGKETPAFCPKCGNKLEAGTVFCSKCGNRLDGAAPAKQAQGSGLANDLVGTLKTFFTKSPDAAVGKAAKNNGLAWTVFGGLSILALMLALPTNITQCIIGVIRKASAGLVKGSMAAKAAGAVFNWGVGLLYGLLLGAVVYFGISFALYAGIKLVHKKDVKLFSVFNMVAVAALPITCAYFVNMLLGLIWIPLAIMLSLCALIASLILLFNGFQKLVAFDKRPTITFVACVSVVVAVIVLVVGIIISSKISNLAGDLVGEIGSGFGSALDSLDSLF